MKIRIEFDENLIEDEIVLRCRDLNDDIQNIQRILMNLNKSDSKMVFYKDDKEYYISLKEILFFETEGGDILAHTIHDIFKVKYRLYELENVLPGYYMRASKSTILNVNQVYSVSYNIASSSLVEFYKTHKQVYVSQSFYKALRHKLNERRTYEN